MKDVRIEIRAWLIAFSIRLGRAFCIHLLVSVSDAPAVLTFIESPDNIVVYIYGMCAFVAHNHHIRIRRANLACSTPMQRKLAYC